MNCRACRGVKARPLRNVRVWRRRDRIASTSSARTSSSVVPSSGKSPSRPSRRSSCSRSFSACLSPVRTRAWSSRARCRNRRRTYWERHSSFLFFSPYFFKSSFSALMRSASHGWDGRSNFARENFGSPNDSLLLLRRLLLFLLFFFLGGGFFRLLRLRGLQGKEGGRSRPKERRKEGREEAGGEEGESRWAIRSSPVRSSSGRPIRGRPNASRRRTNS